MKHLTEMERRNVEKEKRVESLARSVESYETLANDPSPSTALLLSLAFMVAAKCWPAFAVGYVTVSLILLAGAWFETVVRQHNFNGKY